MWAVSVWILLVASTARAQVPPPPPPPPPPQATRDVPLRTGTATIRGRVVAEGGTTPISRVVVRLLSSDTTAAKTAVTDRNGRYELAELPAGKFTLGVSKANYVSVSYGQTRPRGAGKTIELTDGQTMANVNLTMQRTGVITGRILDEFGDPVVDVAVMAMRSQYVNGERRMMPAGGRPATTNDVGDYRLYGLQPGQYYLSATLRNFMMGDNDDRSGYSPTYYPGTGSTVEAQRMTVTAGQTISGINMTLLPVRTSRVTGTAVDSDGKPMAGAMVMAVERYGFGMMARSPGQVRADGTFTVSGLTPGNYTLRAGMPGLPGAGDTAIAPITVADGDITGLQLVAQKPTFIRGRVLVEQGVTPPRASVIRLFASNPEPAMGGGQANLKDDFTFEVRIPAGHYTLRLAGPMNAGGVNDWFLHAVRLNDIDVTDNGFEVSSSGVSDVIVELTKKQGGATGKVIDENGQPLRDAWVVMFALDPQRWGMPTRYVSAARPDVSDVYTVNVPAGDYFIAAAADIEPGDWNDPDVLASLRDRATRVTIGDGERKTMDLKVSR
jgi:protocatechuate 3,4-dioxygenase beta subunit